MEITIIGVGYVGLVTGTCFAEMGHQVQCIDLDKNKIEDLKKGVIPFYEPGLEELVHRNQKAQRLLFSNNYRDIGNSLICFIAVGTPSLENGRADTSQLYAAAEEIAKNINRYTIIVNKSTAPVGTVRKLKNIIENNVKKTIPFDVVSNPEFLKEGSALNDCMKPDRIVIGSDSEQSTTILRQLYSAFTLNHDRILVMDIESAELTKYASNAMLATRISFMNELAGICEKVGANINNIRLGMSSDHRIGYHFLYAGAGYGGSCFPKDIRALKELAKDLEVNTPIIEAVESFNEEQKKCLSKKIFNYFEKKGGLARKNIAIWGLSFKPNTDDMREAPSLTLINFLLEEKARLSIYDPVSMNKAKLILKEKKGIRYCLNEYQTAQNADAIVLVTEWKQFRYVNLKTILSNMKGNVFFDGRNQYKPTEMALKGFNYFGIGIPSTTTHTLTKLRSIGTKTVTRYADSTID